MKKWPFFYCLLITANLLAAEAEKKPKNLHRKNSYLHRKAKKVVVKSESIQDSLDQKVSKGSEITRDIASTKKESAKTPSAGSQTKYWKFSQDEISPAKDIQEEPEQLVAPKLGP